MEIFNQLVAATIWTVLAAIFGFAAHFWKSNFDPYPDRWSGSSMLDIMTTEHSYDKEHFGCEYTDAGFWQWDSLRNLAYYVISAVGVAWFFMAMAGLPASTQILCRGLQALTLTPLFCPA